MTLNEMILYIHQRLKQSCFMDIVENSGSCPSTVWMWGTNPPEKPSLLVFVRFAIYCGLNPTIEQIKELTH